MKKLTISLGIFLIFSFLFILGGCQEGTTTPPTPAPTSAPTTGSISGIVTEMGTGVPLENVTITVDGRTTTTTATDGSYTITNLSPGFHTLKFEKVGYKTQTANVNVVAGSDTPKAMEMENTRGTTVFYDDKDTFLREDSGMPGWGDRLTFGIEDIGQERRMLFEITVSSSYPSNAKMISAKLMLYKTATNPNIGKPVSYVIYPITEAWDYHANWYIRTIMSMWTVPGGTYDETYKIGEGEISLGNTFSWEEIDITKAFEYWQEGHENYGIIVIPKQDAIGSVTFTSAGEEEYPVPYVKVEYYIP